MGSFNINHKIINVSLGKPDVTEEIILNSVKLPDDSPARMKTLHAEGKKWYLTVVYHQKTEQPFALFCHTNHPENSAQTSDAVDRMVRLAERKGVPQQFIDEVVRKVQHTPNVTKVTRVISLLLRHGVLIKNIVSELNKMEDIYIGSFLFQLKKFLGNYVKDGEQSGETCAECGGVLVYSEGCFKCVSCGSSKCG